MNQFKDDNKENLNSFEMSDESSVVEFSDSEISEEEFELDTTDSESETDDEIMNMDNETLTNLEHQYTMVRNSYMLALIRCNLKEHSSESGSEVDEKYLQPLQELSSNSKFCTVQLLRHFRKVIPRL